MSTYEKWILGLVVFQTLLMLFTFGTIAVGFFGRYYYRPGKDKSLIDLVKIIKDSGDRAINERKQIDIENYWTARVACCVEFSNKLGKKLSSIEMCDKCKNPINYNDYQAERQCLIKRLWFYTCYMLSTAKDPAYFYYHKGPRP
jgi:hypothetical protein